VFGIDDERAGVNGLEPGESLCGDETDVGDEASSMPPMAPLVLVDIAVIIDNAVVWPVVGGKLVAVAVATTAVDAATIALLEVELAAGGGNRAILDV
jgi:hypothetical protein